MVAAAEPTHHDPGYRARLIQCMRCDHRQKSCSGDCACTESGRDITEHARQGDCPLKLYGNEPPTDYTPKPRTIDIPLPGDVLEKLAKRFGADRLAKWWERWTGIPCGCAERKIKINRAVKWLLRIAGL